MKIATHFFLSGLVLFTLDLSSSGVFTLILKYIIHISLWGLVSFVYLILILCFLVQFIQLVAKFSLALLTYCVLFTKLQFSLV